MPIRTHVQPFFDLKTLTVSYVVIDIATNNAAVVDSGLDDNFKSGQTDTKAVAALPACVRYENPAVQFIFKTPADVNYTSCARYQQERAGGETVILNSFKKRKTRVRDTGTNSLHPAINVDKCPRGVATTDRRKQSRQLAHPAQRLANLKAA